MKASAVFSLNKTVCHLKSHVHFKSVFLEDDCTVEFEQETLHFIKKNHWILTYRHHSFLVHYEQKIDLDLLEFGQIEVELLEWNEQWNQISCIAYQDKLVLGSDSTCDGVLNQCLNQRHIELNLHHDQIHYRIVNGECCAVNGNIQASEGVVSAPVLIQSGLLSVFLCDQAVLFNCAKNSVFYPFQAGFPEYVKAEYAVSKYIDMPKFTEPMVKEPELLQLPQIRTVSLLNIGPMLTMSCASLITAYLNVKNHGNLQLLIMPLMMLFSSLFWPLSAAGIDALKLKHWKKKRREIYVNECKQLVKEVQRCKHEVVNQIYLPDEQKASEYWQIRSDHPQFLQLPVGYGRYRTDWKIKPAQHTPDISEKACLLSLQKLMMEMEFIDGLLISCNLKEHAHLAFVCHCDVLVSAARTLIVSMGVMMDLTEVHYVLFSNDEFLNWQLRRTELFRFNELSLIASASVSITELNLVLEKLDSDSLIAFVLDVNLLKKISARSRKKMKCVYFLDVETPIPQECTQVYHVNQHGQIKEGKLNLIDHVKTEKMMNQLQVLRKKKNDVQLNQKLLLNQQMSAEKILRHWDKNEGLIAELGTDENGQKISINLSERHEGPHGLIAGMTGSGKSVLLLDMLLSLALHCPPDELQMLILDYKGGTLVQQLHAKGRPLAHLCGGLSNQTHLIGRALSSIRYEALDRQKWFTQASVLSGQPVSNLNEYRIVQKQYPQLRMLAELVIVVDEFAELKREEPEFLKTLISLSRIGRSLGFHLILCTQKISGVVDDEIIGNSRFQIVLKTSRASESRELTGSERAASFRYPGEFLLHVDDILVQGRAINCLNKVKDMDHLIQLTDSCGFVYKTSKSQSNGNLQSEELIELIHEASKRKKTDSFSLWLEPLSVFDAESYLRKQSIFLGIGDFPEIRKQSPVYLMFHQHLLIGYELENQRKGILTFFLKQMKCMGMSTYFVQLASSVLPKEYCIGSNSDQMHRFLELMSKNQNEHTVILVDDLTEFSECFESSQALSRFLFKSVLRNVQIIALCRRPFQLSSLVMDHFERKMIFADIQDSECLHLFHLRRENCRIQLKSQAYMSFNEKICAVQLGTLSNRLKDKCALKTVNYLPDTLTKPKSCRNSLGVCVESLEMMEMKEGQWIVSGTNKKRCTEYCHLIGLEAEILDSFELSEKYTRKTIREKNVLWIGGKIQVQPLIYIEATKRLPASLQEGMVIVDGNYELIRLYDE